jgi:hypothetical protein
VLLGSACGLEVMGTNVGGDDAGRDATMDVVGADVTVDTGPPDATDMDAPSDAPADAKDGGPTDAGDGGPSDAGDGGPTDAGADASDAGTCDASVPDGGLVLLPPGDAGCPMGSVQQILATNPQAGVGACTCGACTPTADPTCGGMLSVNWGGTSSCVSGPLFFANVSNDTCTSFGLTFNTADYNRWTQKVPTGGSCTASAVADLGKVSTTEVRTCVANAPSQVCAAQAAGFRTCIDSPGSCSAPYSVPLTVGTGPTLSCGACSCTRGASGCVVDYYGSSQCTAVLYTHEMDGQCTQTNNANGVSHFKVHATGLTCNATPGAATTGLQDARDLCCTP